MFFKSSLFNPKLILALALSLLLSACDSSSESIPRYEPYRSSKPLVQRCRGPHTHTLNVPIDHSRPDETFALTYEYFQDAGPHAPTLIVIPGGPGQTIIGASRANFPANYNVLLVDFRNVGCQTLHASYPLDWEKVSSENLARDILYLAQKLGLKQYDVYAVSYGTVIGTILGNLAQHSSFPPRTIVLEGVYAHPPGTFSSLYPTMWEQVRSQMSDELKLHWATTPYFLEISDSQWLGFIMSQLDLGQMDTLMGLFKGLSLSDSQRLSHLKRVVSKGVHSADQLGANLKVQTSDSSFSGISNSFYQHIHCTELAGFVPQVGFEKGEIQIKDNHVGCHSSRRLSAPYRPQDWQSHVPLIYMQGKWDPATPAKLASSHHFKLQTTRSDHLFFEFDRSGHNPISYDLLRQDYQCYAYLWQLIGEKLPLSNLSGRCGSF